MRSGRLPHPLRVLPTQTITILNDSNTPPQPLNKFNNLPQPFNNSPVFLPHIPCPTMNRQGAYPRIHDPFHELQSILSGGKQADLRSDGYLGGHFPPQGSQDGAEQVRVGE